MSRVRTPDRALKALFSMTNEEEHRGRCFFVGFTGFLRDMDEKRLQAEYLVHVRNMAPAVDNLIRYVQVTLRRFYVLMPKDCKQCINVHRPFFIILVNQEIGSKVVPELVGTELKRQSAGKLMHEQLDRIPCHGFPVFCVKNKFTIIRAFFQVLLEEPQA